MKIYLKSKERREADERRNREMLELIKLADKMAGLEKEK